MIVQLRSAGVQPPGPGETGRAWSIRRFIQSSPPANRIKTGRYETVAGFLWPTFPGNMTVGGRYEKRRFWMDQDIPGHLVYAVPTWNPGCTSAQSPGEGGLELVRSAANDQDRNSWYRISPRSPPINSMAIPYCWLDQYQPHMFKVCSSSPSLSSWTLSSSWSHLSMAFPPAHLSWRDLQVWSWEGPWLLDYYSHDDVVVATTPNLLPMFTSQKWTDSWLGCSPIFCDWWVVI